MAEKKALEEELSDFEGKGNQWLELMRNWIIARRSGGGFEKSTNSPDYPNLQPQKTRRITFQFARSGYIQGMMKEGLPAFATIIGLIASFTREEQRRETKRGGFIEWLEFHRHVETKELICRTTGLHDAIKEVFLADGQTMLEKLDQVQEVMLTMDSAISESSEIANRVNPVRSQAIDVMVVLLRSGVKRFSLMARFICVPDDIDDFEIESDNIEEDINALVASGYLMDQSANGESGMYQFTRRAFDYVDRLVVS